ncbi:hypothetical protein DFQ05_0480 [Winogradskyella wandonensis]|uniref:Lipoprotein n=1 Tax=Winogradskyella wandonensis TaxID=1442586 RepID=A0A4R1KXE1_9FLAO|nr:hypothetical protein [Winogradskyella wandonensis]TCK68969.1 hypothetical protein DFQ05_0480 [Winogradskyella wandonensis]
MKSKTTFLLLFSFFTLMSCHEELECLFGLEPEINETSIASATLNEPYYQRITAEVDNAVNDNSFDYFFEVIGDFPQGIDVVFLSRSLEILGVPEEAGVFEFTVFLSVERFEDGVYDSSPTCSDYARTDFTLVVNE